ncbi:Helix-turn-helix domain protein [Tepidanaerobacter acetatoxydans Re1]|uniref:Helix-turn-helix domain protein n=1 Tax=Tepidanaerobacter acetatoxydans (strain DSM 21804 / JCM 16047 / Re1) TaxID=1209989 RepID=F4LRN7_TEPAE|nr:helix-turn-helix domain-containing protein [Tepidanaerobacter acetatoxydans]AEE91105.1 helix-turn-helix domain protein [Tepidanaerobacter acetatoxydans Re1]CDI40556.1 Helix-turn-helix domain protein [Tepidanaerobacter acetatoxydans Re1]
MENANIGKKLQLYREQKKITMRELAEKAGITPSMLSQIENGQVNPSINTLKMISIALNVPMFKFFITDDDTKKYIVRKDSRKTIGWPSEEDIIYWLLTPGISGDIEFCIMEIPPHKNQEGVVQSHVGEEVAYILEGPVNILLDGNLYTLYTGDSLVIPSFTNHRWENNSNHTVKIIFAITPPSF